eukprot:scaffold165975_cov28-Tisochrysis_lutea.AAC.1
MHAKSTAVSSLRRVTAARPAKATVLAWVVPALILLVSRRVQPLAAHATRERHGPNEARVCQRRTGRRVDVSYARLDLLTPGSGLCLRNGGP